jgi:hypothetical protein
MSLTELLRLGVPCRSPGIVASQHCTRKTIPGLYNSTPRHYSRWMEPNIVLSPREADLLRKLLLIIRPLIQENAGKPIRGLQVGTEGDVLRWQHRNSVTLADLDPLLRKLKSVEWVEA